MSSMIPIEIQDRKKKKKGEPVRMIQMQLVQAILGELEKQKIPALKSRVFNKIIEGVNNIIDEYNREDIIAKPGAGLAAWLGSDDTGLSSEFMAITLSERGQRRFAEPMDADDFGRCIRMLRVCPDLKKNLPIMKQHGPIWSQIVDYWDRLEQYYDEAEATGNFEKIHGAIQAIHQEVERNKKK